MPLISRMYRKGVPSLSKNNDIQNGKGLDLGAEPSRISLRNNGWMKEWGIT